MPHSSLSIGNRTAPARLAATTTALIALVALGGWAFGLPTLTRIMPGALEMQANTAIALILCGVSLMTLAAPGAPRLERVATVIALTVATLGLASLAEYIFDWQLGIDELLFKDGGTAFNVLRDRMPPLSAAAFVLTGFSLGIMRREAMRKVVNWGAGLVILIGAVSLIGYLWNAGELVTDAWMAPVAVNTAVCFVLLGAGILLSSSAAASTRNARLATVEIRILAGFLLAMTLLLFGGTYTYRTSVQLADSVEWVAHTQEVRASLANLSGSLVGAELAQRDYLLTTQQSHLDEYQRLVDVARGQLADLSRLISDNPAQRSDLAALGTGVARYLQDLDDSLTAYRNYGMPAARAVLGAGDRIRDIEEVRAVTKRMEALEVSLLTERQAQAVGVRHTTLISLLVTLAFASAIFIALFRGVHREMLARREAEGARRAGEEYNRSIVDASPDCLAVLTREARVIQITPQGLRLMEAENSASLSDADWLAFWSGEDAAAASRAVAAAQDGNAGRFQGQCPTRAGTPKWWDVIVMPIQGSDGRTERLLAVARDITEVKRAEADLLEANRFLDSLIENLPVMVFVKDAHTLRYVRQNRATLQMLGLTKEDVIGKLDRDFLPAEQAEFVLSKDQEVLAGGHLVNVPEQSIDTRLFGARVLNTMKMPIFDESGKIKYLLGISVDITERKLAESAVRELNKALEAKASQFEASNRELESFTYSVSHDLRAPLRAIDGFALMLEEDYKGRLDGEGMRYLSVIRENSRRMGLLIDDLLSFSRLGRQAVTLSEVNVDALVREVVEEVLNTEFIGERVAAAKIPLVEVDPLPPARGDRGLLRQVWMNLISNAVKYSSKTTQPVIQISGRPVGAENHYSVRDNGVGFNMQYAGQLFRVFQRLHHADEFGGTGVGLAIVHRVVTRHGGRVWAEGQVDQGAIFSFALPAGERGG
jgi:PAS domain S-box-containing protein